MTDDLNITINVLETLVGSLEGLKFKSTSVEYDSGVSDCINIIEITANMFKAIQESKKPLTREG